MSTSSYREARVLTRPGTFRLTYQCGCIDERWGGHASAQVIAYEQRKAAATNCPACMRANQERRDAEERARWDEDGAPDPAGFARHAKGTRRDFSELWGEE